MKKLLMVSVFFAFNAFANVYPGADEPNAPRFIKIEKNKNDMYSFRFCLIKKPKKCKRIGKQAFYRSSEIERKRIVLKEKIQNSVVGAIITLGFGGLYTAELKFRRNTIKEKNLENDITLKYEMTEEGYPINTIAKYKKRLTKALKL